jgi:predicted RNase H-like nuclease (RuvC/YqgF family)
MTYINKVDLYEKKIAELTEEVKNMKILLKQTDPQELRKYQEIIKQLQSQVNRLSTENQQLREQLIKSSSIVSASSIEKQKPFSSRHFSPREKQYNYLK